MMRQAEIIWENVGKLTCKWLRNMNHKIQATRKNALMHERTRVSIRVKPKNTRFRDSGHKGLRKRGLQGFLRAGGSSNEIFAHTRASAEKVGDIIEFWLGVLDVANVTKGLVDVFEVNTDPADFLNGLEKALRGFGSVARTTSTINDKRRGSFDCTLQPAEAEEVLRILNGITKACVTSTV